MKNKRLLCALVVIMSLGDTNKAFADFYDWWLNFPSVGIEVSYDYGYISPHKSVYPLTFGGGVWCELWEWGGICGSVSVGYNHSKNTKNFNIDGFKIAVNETICDVENVDAKNLVVRTSDFNFVLSPGFCTSICSIKLGFGACRVTKIVASSNFTSQHSPEEMFLSNLILDETDKSWTFLFQPILTFNIPIPVDDFPIILPLRVGYNFVPAYTNLCGLFVGASIVIPMP